MLSQFEMYMLIAVTTPAKPIPIVINKVALIVCGLFIAGTYLNGVMAEAIFDRVDRALPFYGVFIPVGKEFGKILLPSYASKAVDICILYIVPAVLLVTAYVRLREKEF